MGNLKKCLRKKQRNNKASKSRKKRQRNNKKKDAPDPKKWDAFNNSENVCKLPPPEHVSKDYLDALSVQYQAALGVTYTSSDYYYPPYTAGADPKFWEDYKLPPPEPVKDYFDALSVQHQAALGITHTKTPTLITNLDVQVPPVLNSAADPKGWMPSNNSWIDPL